MKKLFFLTMAAIVLTVFNGCQKNEEIIDQNVDDQVQVLIKPDVLVEGDYLVFRDFESYSSISDKLDQMNEEQLDNWENRIGFYSARSLLNEVYAKLDKEESEENYLKVKAEYENRVIFTEDRDILLPFYATAWAKVLNPKGEMKIGNTLYKFYLDREIMIMDGTCKDLSNLQSLLSDTIKVKTFYPNNPESLKTVQWGTLLSGTEWYGSKMRLDWDYQLISLYYTGYGISSTYYTENGFELKHWMRQKRKTLWWSYNETQYYYRNINLHIEFWKMYEGINIYLKYVYNQTQPDVDSNETTQGVTYTFMRYYDVLTGYYSQVIPEIYNNTFTFWSRGIGYDLRKTISYTNQ